jgi:phosphatidylglycerol:prolipoprotein diacylglycerol transferase
MRPVLLHWRGHAIHSYPAMLYVGLVLGVFAGNLASHAARLDSFRVFVAMLALMPLGLIGARLSYVFSHWRMYRRNLWQIWDRSQGGAAHYGGLAIVFLLSPPLLAALGMPLGAFWDVSVFAMLFILFFGRVGCLLNGCCCGRPYDGWGSAYLPDHRAEWKRRIPTQSLEAGWAAALLAVATIIWPWMPFPGALFLAVAALYASGRLVLLSMRDRFQESRLAIHYAFSLLLIVFSLATLTARLPK